MELNALVTLLTNNGIAAVLLYYIFQQSKAAQEESERHKEEVLELSKAVNKLTVLIETVCERISRREDHDGN